MAGKVCLVGAGPGDEGLITVRGLERLRAAEVLVYDALVSRHLVAQAPPFAELIYVGKRAKAHTLTQDQINDVLVEKAKAGALVVRLKGGDPYLFGRGAEEASYLAQRGVEVEIIPGVTSGIAAPAYAGIPVTHREYASSVTFVTGHEDPTKGQTNLDYRALALLIAAGGTVCFYMGVGRLGAIAASLNENGLSDTTPCAVVQWGTTPRQRSVRSTLAHAVADITQAGISSPAIIVVGPVAAINEPGLDFFLRRPLLGQRILITRTRQQASDLRMQLAELGALVLEAPTIELGEPSSWDEIDAALTEIRTRFDWLVLTSANGVTALAARLAELELDARHLQGVKIAAIGSATAEALHRQLAIRADLVPTRYVAESLAGELIAKQQVQGQRFLLLRADIARPALPRLLQEAGAQVTELVAYQTLPAAALPEDVLEALTQGEVDWITFTSSSTAQNLVALLGEQRHLLEKPKLASIGPITTTTMRELGLTPTLEAERSDVPGLVAAIVTACANNA